MFFNFVAIYISTDKGVNIVDKEAKTIKLYNSNNGLKSENVRTILYDHTFSFPRIIWYIVTLYFILMNYSRQILVCGISLCSRG